jgi:photosystem II stability/assembly factor-like uncharacterized protein
MRSSLRILIVLLIPAGIIVYLSFQKKNSDSEFTTKIKAGEIHSPQVKNTSKNSFIHKRTKEAAKYRSKMRFNDNPSSANEKEFREEGFAVEHKEREQFEHLRDKKEAEGLIPEREKILEGNRADHPDLFVQYEKDIRTRSGKNSPDYPMNYRIKELLKSRNITSTKGLKKISSTKSLNWKERGPGNVSGRTRGIIVDPDDPALNTWFAGSVGGGVWKTTNAGGSWTNLTAAVGNLATSTIAMAASNHNVIYAGTGEGFFNADQIDGTGIWKTTDKGTNWEQLLSTADNNLMQNITRIIVDPSNENILLVSATPGYHYTASANYPHSGIFRSTNGGASWNMVYDAGYYSVEDLISNPDRFNTQYATINSLGVIKSLDGGLTWKKMSNGIGPVQRMEIAMAPSDTSTLYFSAEGGVSGSILYVTDNGGANWFALSDTTGIDRDWLGGQGWYDNTIAVDPYDKNSVYVGGVSIFRLNRVAGTDTSAKQITGVDEVNISSFLSFVNWGGRYAEGGLDLGEIFTGLPANLNDNEYGTVEIRFGPGMHQKAHRFIFGSNFEYPYQDYVDVPFEVWDIDHNRQLMVSFRDQDNSGSWNLSDRATAPGGISREYIFINAVPYDSTKPDTNIAKTAGMAYKNIYAFWPEAPAGTTFDPNNLPNSLIRINWGTFITKRLVSTPVADVYGQFGGTSKGVHPDQHNITLIKTNTAVQSFRLVNGNDGGVSYSDDNGATFIQPRNGYNTTQFYGIDKMNGADRFIGGTQDNGSWFSPQNPDNTSSWTPAPSGDGFEAVWNYNNSNEMLESSQYNSIFKTTDGGATWNNADAANGLSDAGSSRAPFITKLAESKQDPDLIFAIGASGVWRSDDFASSWNLIPITSNFTGNATYAQIKISLVNPQIVWAGDGMQNGSNLYVSTDGGITFNAANNYTEVFLGSISGIETDPLKDSTAYALFSFAKTPKILKTTNLGESWTDISGFGTDTVSAAGFPDVAVYSLLVMPYNENIIWAGTEIGIYETTDGGAHWSYADNGFPATAVYEMVIVNDQIVVATHGRGVWSVNIPELANYEPPAITKSPRLNPVAQNPSGTLVIPFTLRSAYDSSEVVINQKVEARLTSNSSVKDTVIFYQVTKTRFDFIQIISYKNGIAYKSFERISEDKVLAKPQLTYSNNFDNFSSDFSGYGFQDTLLNGFSSKALQSPHPYSDNNNYIDQLLIPIIVASSNATITYRDIAIVEPGESGSKFGDNDFYDYVVVEGTKDGLNWLPLADGYDARTDNSWLSAFNSNSAGDSTMFKNEQINILNTFSAGDTILIRFRLFADPGTHAWGWAVDNLVIQGTFLSVNDKSSIPTSYDLAQNFPNPFNPSTTIKFQLPQQERVVLEIYNILGEKVKTLIDEIKNPGFYQTIWNGTNNNNIKVASGIYIYRIAAGKFVASKKLVLLK